MAQRGDDEREIDEGLKLIGRIAKGDQRIVLETDDNPVVRQGDLEIFRTELVKHRIGLAVIAAMVASPRLGGPTAPQAVTAAIDTMASLLGGLPT